MGFFDELKDKATGLAQSGVAKSKQLAEIAKLRASNLGEEDTIKKAYLELGKLYYAERGFAPEGAFSAACERITAAKAAIEANNDRIAQLRSDSGLDEAAERAAGVAENLKDVAIDAAGKARDAAADVAEKVRSAVSDCQGAAEAAAESAQETVEKAVETVEEAVEQVEEKVEAAVEAVEETKKQAEELEKQATEKLPSSDGDHGNE